MLNETDTLYYLRLAKDGDKDAKEKLLSENISLLKTTFTNSPAWGF